MRMSCCLIAGTIAFGLLATGVMSAQSASTWTIPASAAKETSPLKPTPAVLKKGRALFESRCLKCHGPAGMGDGRDADPKNKPANLITSSADLNPDGVLFYKVWNGQPPKMPAFKSQMSRDEVWTVVEYAKSLRKPQ